MRELESLQVRGMRTWVGLRFGEGLTGHKRSPRAAGGPVGMVLDGGADPSRAPWKLLNRALFSKGFSPRTPRTKNL